MAENDSILAKIRETYSDSESLRVPINTLLDEAETVGDKATVKAFGVVQANFDTGKSAFEIIGEGLDVMNSKMKLVTELVGKISDEKAKLKGEQQFEAGRKMERDRLRRWVLSAAVAAGSGLGALAKVVMDHYWPPRH